MKNIFIGIAIFFFIFAYWLQCHLAFHGDVNYLLYITQLVLSGITQYGIDFFETNPPMILFLYLPIVLLNKYFAISLVAGLRLYVFCLAFVSLLISSKLLKQIIHNRVILFFFISIMLYGVLIFPVNQFGQREHLFIILILPYIFASVLRLEKQPIFPILAILIGIFAGLGFSIKPYFLFPLIFIETYFIIQSKSLFGWVRVETVIILTLLVSYLFITLMFFPTYFSIILPLINQFYFIGIKEPWIYIFSSLLVQFSLVVACLYFLKHNDQHSSLKIILFLSLTGLIITLLSTHTSWFYHVIPVIVLACLMLSLHCGEMLSDLYSSNLISLHTVIFFVSLVLLLFYIPFSITYSMARVYMYDKNHGGLVELTKYLSVQSGEHSITCFSANTTGDCFPLTLDSNSTYGSRFPFFWWMRGIMALSNTKTMPKNELVKYTNYFIENIAMDLNHFQPRWIIINKFSEHYIFGDSFSFIEFFSQNELFRQAWVSYRYKRSIAQYELYERKKRFIDIYPSHLI